MFPFDDTWVHDDLKIQGEPGKSLSWLEGVKIFRRAMVSHAVIRNEIVL